jgi:hypothetical protein
MKAFAKYLLIWVSQNLAVPFWVVGHIHLMTTVYEDIHEIVMSMGMNIIVIAGIIVDYNDKKRDSERDDDNDHDIPIGWV